MSLDETLKNDYIIAYKEKEAAKLTVLRLLKTAMTNRLVELKQPGSVLPDDEILNLILKQAKQRRDSIEQFEAAGRQDLADKEAQELAILEAYLPKQMDDGELAEIIKEQIKKIGAAGPKDMGKVLGPVMASCKGRIDGKKASEIARRLLDQI